MPNRHTDLRADMIKFEPTALAAGFDATVRRAAAELLPYDRLPSPSKVMTDKDVRRTAGKVLPADRLNTRVRPEASAYGSLKSRFSSARRRTASRRPQQVIRETLP